jgi:hypothetical protein
MTAWDQNSCESNKSNQFEKTTSTMQGINGVRGKEKIESCANLRMEMVE